MNWKQYWRELQRRHVVKAGIAYLVVAWLLIQVLSILLPVFKAPDWIMQLAVIVLAVGFPIWLIVAWVYDFSWGSIKKTEDVPYDPAVSRKKNVGLNRVIIGGLAIAVILLVVNTVRLSGKVDTMEEQFLAMEFTNSLAILPFQDLSPKQDQRYFSDGLARSIYDRLSQSKDLKLISPTSSFLYRNKDVSIEVIAEELGVRYILEGSVQLFNDHYRASINLVDTQNGATIWSKSFDDTLEDVLRTYDEIAYNIGEFLNVTISSADVRARKVDPEAYLLYLRVNDTIRSEGYNKAGALAADSLIRESIRIDPTYSASQATLSMTTLHKGLYYGEYEFDEAIDIGLKAARKAIELAPENYYGYNWLSNWQWHAKDGKGSSETLKKALELAPNNAGVYYYAAFNAARQNRIQDCLDYSERAVTLDPKNEEAYGWILYSNFILGDLDRAEWVLNKAYETDDVYLYGDAGYLYYLRGEFTKALEYSEKSPIDHSRLFNQTLIYDSLGDFVKSDSTLNLLKEVPDDENLNLDTAFYLAAVYAQRKENDLAFEYLKQAEEYVQISLEFFFTFPEFRNLYNDPRWDAYIDRLREEFNYDFPKRS
jgi:TolB-like protein/Tfp pilus assembly protein PilF